MQLNLAHLLPRSAANGPGERFVVWVQGCSLRCPGCWNPDTWSLEPRLQMSVDDLVAEVLGTRGIEGVTLTGGEPFEQAASLASLCARLRAHGLSVMAFTGYRLRELVTPDQKALLDLCDIVVAGRYLQARRVLNQPWRGSSNQVVHYRTNRYASSAGDNTICEVHLGPDGEMHVTGFPPDALLAET
ncbi:radical SAM protein [Pseudenhygromyxa sp. WMMC2535]|uniref:4Fe-4S single cluster domain-containing protein n=1 Tax=Pseudenhygromyxa sp. WMMC2535 TaxID=2712867 RepID=UPI0015531EF0|nr:4Fe-4S single cluster domain-containing protein [Pseudenhygromyxa sp. WMMC2535]NVB38596.1 radical SAM protein [Pseudenhygromyxa sp. WMMC2535]